MTAIRKGQNWKKMLLPPIIVNRIFIDFLANFLIDLNINVYSYSHFYTKPKSISSVRHIIAIRCRDVKCSFFYPRYVVFLLNELRGRRECSSSSTSTSNGVGGAQRRQAGRDGGIFWAKRETHQPFRCERVKMGLRMSAGRRHRTACSGLIHRTIEKPPGVRMADENEHNFSRTERASSFPYFRFISLCVFVYREPLRFT